MQCLKVLTMSGWNPPPGNRKMHGDLMYLYIVTVEERHVSVTASTRGFYLNQSVSRAVLSLLKLWDKGFAAKKPPSRVLTFAPCLIDGKGRILSLDPGWTPLGGDLTIKLMRTNRITWNVWKDVAAFEGGVSFSVDFICKNIAFFGNNVEKSFSWSCIAQQFSLVLSLSDVFMLKKKTLLLPDLLPTPSTLNQLIPVSWAIHWWSCSARSALPSRKTSLPCKRKGASAVASDFLFMQ